MRPILARIQPRVPEFALADVAARHRVRLVAPDRPGYGHSTDDPDRTYESWARDVGQLADHLGLETFAVLGTSSGGPNAAGCARFLGDRLIGCAIVSGPAPPDAQISKREMLRPNRATLRMAAVAPCWLHSRSERDCDEVSATPKQYSRG